jgi:hypothetical protein
MERTSTYSLPEGKVLALKVLYPNRQSYHNKFQYPEVGQTVSAPDWDATKECGHGLHGYLWGEGDIAISLYQPGEILLYQIHEVGEHISLPGKIKYPSALVVKEFDSIIDALSFLEIYTPANRGDDYVDNKVVEVMDTDEPSQIQYSHNHTIQKAGRSSIQKADENTSLQSSKNLSIQIARDYSHQTSEWDSIQVVGDKSKQFSGDYSIQKADSNSVQQGGGECIQLALNKAIQAAGDYAIQRSGSDSRLSAGKYSIQRAGYRSMCQAGLNSHIFIYYYSKSGGVELAYAFVDGKKIKEYTWYKVEDKTGKFYEVDYEGKRNSPSWKTKFLERLAPLADLFSW